MDVHGTKLVRTIFAIATGVEHLAAHEGPLPRPVHARHSSVSWNLMIGGNPLRVAKNHGHGVQTILEVYAAWIEGAQESDVEAIKEAMAGSPRARARAAVSASANASNSSQRGRPQSPEVGTDVALSRKVQGKTWRRERDSNPRRAFDPTDGS
jgi:hypothetical protein